MILYQNSLMQLDFDPAKGLMVVNWPNFEAYSLADTKLALSRLVNTVKNYDVKMLLVDASNAKMELELEAYEEVVKHFIVQFLETSLEKIARVKTTDAARENRAQEMIQHLPVRIRLANFTSSADARAWLLNENA